jgi:hypothetical protein
MCLLAVAGIAGIGIAASSEPARGTLPLGGTLVLLGTFAERRHWLARARPERLIIVYNTPELHILRSLLEFASEAALPKPELVFPSATHRASAQMAGFVDWGFYDFNLFRPAPRPHGSDAFVVGRLSRDKDYKHHPRTPAVSPAGARAFTSG